MSVTWSRTLISSPEIEVLSPTTRAGNKNWQKYGFQWLWRDNTVAGYLTKNPKNEGSNLSTLKNMN